LETKTRAWLNIDPKDDDFVFGIYNSPEFTTFGKSKAMFENINLLGRNVLCRGRFVMDQYQKELQLSNYQDKFTKTCRGSLVQ